MDSSKQFRVDRETKGLTRQMAEQINQAHEKFEAVAPRKRSGAQECSFYTKDER